MPQLKCENLTLGYEGKTVVKNLSFEVNKGDYLCIVGENGSGKTTLLKAMLGLKPPMSGGIVMGAGLTQQSIGYLPQQTIIQKDFPASVEEVVLMGALNRCGLRPFFNNSEREDAKKHMNALGILPLAKRCYRELSGGQQQRVLLARALLAAKDILIMDEPTAGLDPGAAAEMYAIIEELNKKGASIIMISHDVAFAMNYATHILHIGRGDMLFFGIREDYVKSGHTVWGGRANA